MLDTLLHIDHQLFVLLNQGWQHPWLDVLLPIWRTKTTWIPLYAVLLVFLAKNYKWKTFGILLLIGATIALADQVSSGWIKHSIQRLRPCRTDSLAEQIRVLVHCGSGFSFTSSHACNHFALVMQLFLLFRTQWKNYIWILGFLWAATIAYGQVYVGVHYPLDVLAGAVLGMLLAGFVYGAGKALGVVHYIHSSK